MNQYVTGSAIYNLRKKANLTQQQLAEKLNVTDKAISKWETGKGYPDISLLEPISKVFGVSISELLSGNTIENNNVSANMLKTKFYVCPICGNVINSIGELAVSCHGINLQPLIPEEVDEMHQITIEKVEDEYYVEINHPMSKSHYISFISGISIGKIEIVKQYPESISSARLKINSTQYVYFYCNKDGLFKFRI